MAESAYGEAQTTKAANPRVAGLMLLTSTSHPIGTEPSAAAVSAALIG